MKILIKEWIEHPIINEIIEAKKTSPELAQKLLSQEPPTEWGIKQVSEITGEEYINYPIEFLELLVEKIFGWYELKNVQVQNIQTQTSISVTTSLNLIYPSLVLHEHSTWGVGSVVVRDNYFYRNGKIEFITKSYKPLKAIDQLPLATPLSLTMAKKNAMRNICNLFGRNLYRHNDELPIILTEVAEEKENKIEPTEDVNIEYKTLITRINEMATTYEEAISYRDKQGFKYNIEINKLINQKFKN